jgi:radical SAM superfamily enzyme YgiQ (UPF0313 family)
MRIVLVSAPTATDFRCLEEINHEDVRASIAEPPLGVLSLAAVLLRAGLAPGIVDLNQIFFKYVDGTQCNQHRSDFAEFAATQLIQTGATVFGFSSICSSYPLTIRIAAAVKRFEPEATIVLGGPQASVVSRETVREFPHIDFVVRGEAERTLLSLLDELESARRFDRVLGLTYRRGDEVLHNGNASVLESLDEIPLPAYHLTNYLHDATTGSLELGRGCPFACSFCSTNDFFRRRFRLRSPARVLADMRQLRAQYGIAQFTLVHDMFTVDRKRVVDFCHVMAESGDGFKWSCSARTDSVDDELLAMMSDAGCRGVFYGVETGSQRIQKIINKNLDITRAKRVIDLTEKLGMESVVSLIAGFPEETWGDVKESLDVFMHSTRCTHSDPQLNILAPLAGTPLHEIYKDRLVLEELCSDMSHQGRSQDVMDLDLIKRHPDMFPNFYLLPLMHIEDSLLFELHEFQMSATEAFRWLLVAIDQAYLNILDFFLQWQEYRLTRKSLSRRSDIRHYYRTSEFRAEMLLFLRRSPASSIDVIDALLRFYETTNLLPSRAPRREVNCEEMPKGAKFAWNDIPFLQDHANVFELEFNIQELVNGLKSQAKTPVHRGPNLYMISQDSDGKRAVSRVPEWAAMLLRECDGNRNISSVMEEWCRQITTLEHDKREYAFLKLLEGAHEKGWISIHRPAQ